MDWHRRYLQQAAWTQKLRQYLLANAGIESARRVLEVGCGTGAILIDLCAYAHPPSADQLRVHGLDIQPEALVAAHRHAPDASLSRGDVHRLPLRTGTFDITCSHFLLLWLSDPLAAIREMRRVTRTGGHVLAFAEPDYSQRVDEPPELAQLGKLQRESLDQQGADTSIGPRVAALFVEAGLSILEAGAIDAQDASASNELELQAEWDVLKHDLGGSVSGAELDRLYQEDLRSRRSGERKLHVPTFFVHGQV